MVAARQDGSRREFLRQVGAAAAAMSLAPSLAPWIQAAGGEITLSGSTRLDLLRMLSRPLDHNVLKLFRVIADPVRNRLYVAGIMTQHLAVLDATTHAVLGTIDSGILGNSYKYLALDTTANRLYIRDGINHQLMAMDLNTGGRIGPVALPAAAIGDLVADPARGLVYLTTTESPGFRAFDGATLATVFTTTAMGSALPSMVHDATADALYVLDATQATGRIYRMKLSDRSITTIAYAVNPLGRPSTLAYSRADNRFFVCVANQGIVIVSPEGRVERTLTLPALGFEDMAFNDHDGRLLALFLERPANGEIVGSGARLWSYDGRNWAESAAFGHKTHSIAINPANGRFYCPSGDESKIWNGVSGGSSVSALRLGDSVEHTVPSSTGTVYLTSRLGGSYVSAFDPGSRTVETFTAGTWPTAIAVDPANRYLLVLNAWDSTISLFELPSRRLLSTIGLGIPAGTTDRLPDLAVDFTRGFAYAAYPEFGQVAVVDWRNGRALTPITVDGFTGGDVGGGPNQLQVALTESNGRLFVLSPSLRRLDTYDITGSAPSWISQTQVALTQGGERLAWKTLFVDAARDRAFVGGDVYDARTGRAVGTRLSKGQRVFAADDVRNVYWAASIVDEVITVYTLDRSSLTLVDTQALGPVDYLGPDLALDAARGRLYVTHLAAAQFDEYSLS